jgi:hypothetical protein
MPCCLLCCWPYYGNGGAQAQRKMLRGGWLFPGQNPVNWGLSDACLTDSDLASRALADGRHLTTLNNSSHLY